MLRKLKAKYEAEQDATTYAIKIVPTSKLRTTGGTNWTERAPQVPSGPGTKFRHMNTEQFYTTLGARQEEPT